MTEVLRPTRASRPSSWPRKTVAAGLLIVAACLAIYLSRDALLRAAADVWIVSDAIGPADAVVVLGGGLETRPIAAAEYYRQGFAKKVLVANARPGELERLGIVPPHTEANRAALMKLGVPESDIEIFGTALSNTHDEALALRTWLLRSHARTVIVPTEIFETRRVRWVMERALEGTGAKIEISALTERDYSRDDWWRSEKGIVGFQNEVLKYVYYRLKY
jgi:uncharacterized SAM-binding protein YcdF (DUF218 family)